MSIEIKKYVSDDNIIIAINKTQSAIYNFVKAHTLNNSFSWVNANTELSAAIVKIEEAINILGLKIVEKENGD